jgi:hypothetical protein
VVSPGTWLISEEGAYGRHAAVTIAFTPIHNSGSGEVCRYLQRG